MRPLRNSPQPYGLGLKQSSRTSPHWTAMLGATYGSLSVVKQTLFGCGHGWFCRVQSKRSALHRMAGADFVITFGIRRVALRFEHALHFALAKFLLFCGQC